MTQTLYIALGSNLGERAANLRAALDLLPPQVAVLAESNIYETPPWGITDQPAFLNMVIQAETALAPVELLKHLKDIETRLGRAPAARYGPRLIDLDILFYGEQVIDSPPLVIPHPRLHERGFVLVPLAELAPELRHPLLGKTIRELLANIDTAGIRLYNLDRPRGAQS
jgi:2-amino-4-hydroxy-6-hydroxymethyldihydropteridine diphosphokinase